MKKYLMRGLFLIFAFLSCSWVTAQDLWDGTIATSFYAGSGTTTNPYQIRTGAQLMYFINEINAGNDFGGKTIKIMNDIDLNNKAFLATKNFAGTIDGGGHFLTVTFYDSSNLFTSVSGTILNLGIKGSVQGNGGYPFYGTIYLAATLAESGIIENCYYIIVGGYSDEYLTTLVQNNNGLIKNCYATGSYRSYNDYVRGMLVFNNLATGIVENCAANRYYNEFNPQAVMPLIESNNGTLIEGTNTTLSYFAPPSECTVEFLDPLFNQSIPSIHVVNGEAVGNLPILTEDCTFLGWKRLGEYVSATDVVSSNWTLTAQWEQRIRKQPTATDMSVEVDDIAHASFQWYCSTGDITDLGQWQSTNHSRESTSSKTINFNASVGDMLEFTYYVSSEKDYDYFSATLNGVQVLKASGEETVTFSKEITQDGENVLVLKYVKDDDTSEGSDMVTVTDISVSAPNTPLTYTTASLPQSALTAGNYYFCKVSYSNTGRCLTSDRVLYVILTNGDTFTATTVEGVEVTYTIINVDQKTCQVGYTYDKKKPIRRAIDQSTTGSVTIPAVVNGYSVKYISDYAFSDCSDLTSVIIPNSVTSIEEYAFKNCIGLTSVNIPNTVHYFGDCSFQGCKSLTTINIPEGVYYIGEWAFYNCENLLSVTIPSSVTTIYERTFDGCTNLSSVTLSENLQYIGSSAFNGSKITSITLPKSFTTSYQLDHISNTGTQIGTIKTLNKVVISKGVSSLYEVFRYCHEYIQTVICYNEEPVNAYNCWPPFHAVLYVPKGSKEKYESDNNWNHFSKIIEMDPNVNYDEVGDTFIANGVTYMITGVNPREVQVGLLSGAIDKNTVGNIDIPSAVINHGNNLEYAVTSICSSAFRNCSNINSITIPNSVTSIGDNAFYGCSSLTSVTIPNNITSIGEYAFYGCSGLTSFISEIEEPFVFGSSAFYNISPTCTLTVPYGKKDAYIAAGWTEDIFKGGVVETAAPKEEQSMKLASLPAKIYGDASYTLPATTIEGLTLTWTSTNTNVATINGNTLTIVGAGTATITASQAGNEEYKPFSKEFALTVAKAPLTIMAQDFTRYEGEENPAFTVSYEGFVKNEDATVLTAQPVIATTATVESAAGTYPITVSGATAANYDITFVAGTLTVQAKSTQTIALTSLPDMTYGGDTYTLPAQTEEGFDLTWASSNTAVATISGNTLTVKGAGTATITASQSGNEEYKPFGKKFALTVAKAPLTITASDATKNVGEENPAFTASYEGFVGDDDASVLTTQPTFTTQADENSPVGTYAIVVSGAEAANYEISYVDGTLTVVDEWSMSNTLSLTDAQVLCGRQIVLPVSMSNTEDITAIQFDLTLPAGVSIAKNSKGKYIVEKTERCADHTLSASKPGEANVYKVLLYSTDVESITGNEGAVINVTLEAAEYMEAGDYEVRISNINLTTTAEKKITPADATCVLTVRNSIPGDANGDSSIDVTDIVAIANSILGHASESFDTVAADVNGDGSVDVTDIVVVANIILHDGGANAVKLREAMMQVLDPQ